MREIKIGGHYRHFKGKEYKVLGLPIHSETVELYVYYVALYDPYNYYIRPYEMFVSKVDKEKYPNVTQEYRFEFLR